MTLPELYPLSPPSLSLTCSVLSNTEQASILSSLQALAHQNTLEKESEGGLECLIPILSSVQTLLPLPSPSSAPPQPSSCSSPIITTHCLIDHMNAPKPYVKLLRTWASSLPNLSLSLFYKRSPKNHARYTQIHVLLQGSPSSTSTFLTHLRTSYVDVNSQGSKCKERQSSVIHSGVSEVIHEGERIEEYKDEELAGIISEFYTIK